MSLWSPRIPGRVALAVTALMVLTMSACSSLLPLPSPAPEVSSSGSPSASPSVPTAPDLDLTDGWSLTWSDEFDGDAVDEDKWTVLNESTFGEGNLELACLMARNVAVRDGVMTITAQREQDPVQCGGIEGDPRFPDGRSYTSGFVETRPHAAFTYGAFEIRAKTPTAAGVSKGLWPAFWMRPTDRGLGELDILEIFGTDRAAGETDTAAQQTIHYDYSGTHPQELNVARLADGSTFSGDFHTFSAVWEPGSIDWYIDGRLVHTRSVSTTPWLDEAFSREMFLRLNLAVGGNAPGAPDADTAFPARFEVDYVRVYQR